MYVISEDPPEQEFGLVSTKAGRSRYFIVVIASTSMSTTYPAQVGVCRCGSREGLADQARRRAARATPTLAA